MEELILEAFQERGIQNISSELTKVRNVLAVSPTGSGKGIIIAAIINRFLNKNKASIINEDETETDISPKVIVLVHKKELLDQIRYNLIKYFDIDNQAIMADTIRIENVRVYVSMVETFDRRSSNIGFLEKFSSVRLAIFDEAHLGNHRKIFIHFTQAKRIGFTATPISAIKTHPMNKDYNSIIVIATIKELLELNKKNPKRGVVQWKPFKIDKNINRDEIKKTKNGKEFDEEDMSMKFGSPLQLSNTVKAYKDFALGKKTLCFCVDKSHSIKMNQFFLNAGYNSRHIDSDSSKAYREEIFGTPKKPGWIHITPDAILCNVGIATIGTDIPSIECIILNSSMVSYTVLAQKLGRGGRPCQYSNGDFKKYFLCLDMGDNFDGGKMPYYDAPIDWKYMFDNPKIPKPSISGAFKTCPICKAMNFASSSICKALREDLLTDTEIECGYEFPFNTVERQEDEVPKGMIAILTGIDVKECINFCERQGKKPWASFHELIKQIANSAWNERNNDFLEKNELRYVISNVKSKLREWHRITKLPRYNGYSDDIKSKTIEALRQVGFDVSLEEYEMLVEEDKIVT